MKTKDHFLVQIKILDFECEASDISEILQLEPSLSWKKGDLASKMADRYYQNNGWCIRSTKPNYKQLEDHLKNLFDKIRPKLENFKKLPKECYIELDIYIEKYSESASLPALGFTKDDIEILYKIGANVDFDIYVLNKN